MKYKMKISYVGKGFSGWQKQDNAKSVQQYITDAMVDFLQVPINLVASGRTDKGVSAIGQVCHFEIDVACNEKKLQSYLNHMLAPSVSVLDIVKTSDDFHARFNTKKKTYAYNFYISKVSIPYYDTYATRFIKDIDIDVLLKNVDMLIGTHDFTSFCAANSGVDNKVRTVYDAQLSTHNGVYTFTITGNGFLYNMVRIIVGTLIDIATKKLSTDIAHIINQKDRKCAGITASQKGLVLVNVEY